MILEFQEFHSLLFGVLEARANAIQISEIAQKIFSQMGTSL